jgi:hypothetical protein
MFLCNPFATPSAHFYSSGVGNQQPYFDSVLKSEPFSALGYSVKLNLTQIATGNNIGWQRSGAAIQVRGWAGSERYGWTAVTDF